MALGAFPLSVMAAAFTTAALHVPFRPVAKRCGMAWRCCHERGRALRCRVMAGPVMAVAALFIVSGFLLGSAQGIEITSAMSGPKFILEAGCTGLIGIAYGIGLVRRPQRPWAHIAVRVVGSWVAAAGLMVLALTRSAAPH